MGGLPRYEPKPQPPTPNTPTTPGRVTLNTIESATIGNERLLRGIPVAGIGGGAIHGTRPGDSSYTLIRDEQHLTKGRMTRTRRKDHR